MLKIGVSVRCAEEKDFGGLEELERAVWGEEGTDVYTAEHFAAWREVHPEAFLVAEEEGKLVGLAFSQTMQLDEFSLPPGATFNSITDYGRARATHSRSGNVHFGVTICSVSRGAGGALIRSALAIARRNKRLQFGVARLPGFAAYALERERRVGYPLTPDQEADLALHYVLESVRMVGGERHPLERFTPRESYPKLSAPDAVLRTYLRHAEFRFYQLLPAFWVDPKCRGFSVLFGEVHAL